MTNKDVAPFVTPNPNVRLTLGMNQPKVVHYIFCQNFKIIKNPISATWSPNSRDPKGGKS